MKARVGIVGGEDGELSRLWEWPSDEDALRGRTAAVAAPPDDTQLGAVTEFLDIAFGGQPAHSVGLT